MEERCDVCELWPADTPGEVRRLYEAAVDLSETEPERARTLMGSLAARRPEDRVIDAWMQRLAA